MKRVMHVIRTVDTRQTGGAEELLLLLAPSVSARGEFDQSILLLRRPSPDADPSKDFGNRARGLGIDVLPLQEMRWTPAWLRSLPRRRRVSIIHTHGQRANYFIWLMRHLFPRTWGRPALVATVHGWVQDTFVRKVVTWLEIATLRDCDYVITVSELQRQTLLGLGFSPNRVGVVRPGIPYLAAEQGRAATPEERLEARAHWGIPAGAFVITAVGRLSTEKRFDVFLHACAELAEKLPNACFLLVGGGKQETTLLALRSELQLDGRAIFTGFTREMPLVYAATDLLMLTSDTEGTPHVLLEAMGSGIPVVSTAVGGIPEFITTGVNGLLSPPGDSHLLAEAALRLHNDPELRARLVMGGRAVAAGFTVDHMVEGVEGVYRRVLRGKKG